MGTDGHRRRRHLRPSPRADRRGARVSYAEKTSVTAESSRSEIERTLIRYGADQFMYGWNELGAVIQFRANERYVKFVLPMPLKSERRFTHHSRGTRTADAALKEW